MYLRKLVHYGCADVTAVCAINSYYIRINGDGGKIHKFADKMQENNICLYVCRVLNLNNDIVLC